MSGDSLFTNSQTYRALGAEFLGTTFLVFLGTGCGVKYGDESVSLTQVALAVGFILATIIQAIGHISGGHINPAVTVSMMVARKISLVLGLLYIVVQCIGATAGSALLMAFLPPDAQGNLGATVPNISPFQAAGVEFLATFIFIFTIFSVCDGKRSDIKGSVPLAIGLAGASVVFVAGPLSGCSLNPARSLGPAIMSGVWTHHWVYWIGPVAGGALAAIVYQRFFKARPQPKQGKKDGGGDGYEMCAKRDGEDA